jgi:hypothetical protein
MNSAARQGMWECRAEDVGAVRLWPIREPASERQVDGTIRGVSLVVIRRVLPEHIRGLRKWWPIRNVRIRAIGHLRIRIGTGDGRKDDCGSDRRRDQPGSVPDRCSHGWFCPSDDFVCSPPNMAFLPPEVLSASPRPDLRSTAIRRSDTRQVVNAYGPAAERSPITH